VRKDT